MRLNKIILWMPLFFQCHLNSFKMDKVNVWFHILYLNIIYLEFTLRYFFYHRVTQMFQRNFYFFAHFFLFYFIFCCSNTFVTIFSPPLSPVPPTPTSHPQSYPSLALAMGPLYMFLDDPSPSFLCYPPLPSPLVTLSLFFISVFLVLFCLLVCFID